jgi:chromosome segregation ATPase
MIAEQEAALSRFQNSAYLAETQGAAASRGARGAAGAGGRTANNAAQLNFSASSSPYTFQRHAARSGLAAAPTPGYARPARDTSPTGSTTSSQASSEIGINSSLMAKARRTIADAAAWSEAIDTGRGGAGVGGRALSSSLSSFGGSMMHGGGAGLQESPQHPHNMSTATITSELESKMWTKDKLAWEKRMAELETRLKQVNTAAQQQAQLQSPHSAAAAQQPGSPLNIPIVGGRGIVAGLNAAAATALATSGNGGSHNVHTSGLVLRLEQELATAVEALVRERTATAQRERELQQTISDLQTEVAHRDQRLELLNSKWQSEFDSAHANFKTELQSSFSKQNKLAEELGEAQHEIEKARNEVKKLSTRLASATNETKEALTQNDELRLEYDKTLRAKKDLEIALANADFERKNILADFEQKAKAATNKLERAREDFNARLENQKAEQTVKMEKEARNWQTQLQAAESKWREMEHDCFVLSSELTKLKDTIAARDIEIEKLKSLVTLETQKGEQRLKQEHESWENESRKAISKLQAALDESNALLMDSTQRFEAESRNHKTTASRLADVEDSLNRAKAQISEGVTREQALQSRVQQLQRADEEKDSALTSMNQTLTGLRAHNQTLLEEVQLLQKKLDSKTIGKQEELKLLEVEHKKYREKSRQRTEELEKQVDELRLKANSLEQRNESMKSDFTAARSQTERDTAELVSKLERKITKIQAKLDEKTTELSVNTAEKDRLITQLRSELQRRLHSEEQSARQIADLEAHAKNEQSRAIELEAKLNHVLATAPDGVTHARTVSELTAAKQVAANIQSRYKELQAKFERLTVREKTLENLVERMQDERMNQNFRSPAKGKENNQMRGETKDAVQLISPAVLFLSEQLI